METFSLFLLLLLFLLFHAPLSTGARISKFSGIAGNAHYSIIVDEKDNWGPEQEDWAAKFLTVHIMDHSPERDDLIYWLSAVTRDTEEGALEFKLRLNNEWCRDHFRNQSLGIRRNQYLYKPYYSIKDCVNKTTFGVFEIPPVCKQESSSIPKHISINLMKLLAIFVICFWAVLYSMDMGTAWTLGVCCFIYSYLFFFTPGFESEFGFVSNFCLLAFHLTITLSAGMIHMIQKQHITAMFLFFLFVTVPFHDTPLVFFV
jgi:hypothetical protein